MTQAGATPPLLKQLNARTVLEAIRAHAPISRAEISRQVGISKPTVSLALQALLDAGLVREARAEPGRPSYGAIFFEPVPDAALVLGLDLGARFLRGAICDLRGDVRARHDLELRDHSAAAVLDTVERLYERLVDAVGLTPELIEGATMGVPGVVGAGSGAIRLTHLSQLEGARLGEAIAERLDVSVTLENDINLAALGEQWQGVARGVEDFAFLSVGTGLGAGIVLRGELHRGRHGAAGEVDYVSSGLALDIDPSADRVADLAARRRAPTDARALFAAARAGDKGARDVVEEVARRIALHITPIAAVTDVELVVLGGGLGVNADLLLDPVRARLGGWLPYPPRLEVSSLGDAAVLMGALAVGLRGALDNVFVARAFA